MASSPRAADASDRTPSPADAEIVPIAGITLVAAWRRRMDLPHARAMGEYVDDLPPITLAADLRLVDGEHRLHAHRAAGRDSIRAVLLDASLDDVELMALAIEANVRHGRPPSTGERTGKAIDLLACGWNGSDAELARRCGIARARVPELRIRAAARRATDAQDRPDCSKGLQPVPEDRLEGPGERRVARGGRSYPGDPAAQRERILDEAGRQPSASNAAIARAVGCSPSTVASVRAGIQPGASPSRLGRVLGRVRSLIGVLARLFVRC
jgi:hypothetical protein